MRRRRTDLVFNRAADRVYLPPLVSLRTEIESRRGAAPPPRLVLFRGPSPKSLSSCRGECGDFLDLVCKFLFGHLEIESALHIDPQLRTVAAKFADAQRHRRRDRLLLGKDIVKRLT